MKLLVLFILKIAYRLLDELTPKDERIVIFASKSGKLKNANAVELWSALKNHTYFQAYLVNRIRNSDSEINLFTLKGLFTILRAKYVFLTHGPGDVIYAWYSKRKIVTYVGHSITLKSYFFTNKIFEWKNSIWQRLEVPGYDYIVASSPADQQTLKACFKKTDEQVIITGVPRNDLVFRPQGRLKALFPHAEKFVLYAPTFRDDQDFAFFPFSDFNVESLEDFLRQNKIVLMLRGHVNNKQLPSLGQSEWIVTLNQDKIPEVQDVLGEVDMVVSDYSSIYIDFLLTDRPVMFLPYDLDKYHRMRGLLYEYEKVTPGPHVFTQSEFIKEIQKLLNDRSYYLPQRKQVKEFFHSYSDGNAHRVLKKVLKHYE